MKIINGKEISLSIREEIKAEAEKLPIRPGLAVILVGSDPASQAKYAENIIYLFLIFIVLPF